MRRILGFFLVLVLIALFSSSFPMKLSAADYIIGAKVWYTYWNPYLKDMAKLAKEEGWQDIDGGTGMMYGPSAAVMITDHLSISVSYLYGMLNAHYESEFTYNNRDYDYSGKAETRRHDLDCALSYVVTGSFKLFAGFKYQPLEMDVEKNGAHWDLPPSGSGRFVKSDMTIAQRNYAPGIGVGYSYSISNFLVFTANASCIYFVGTMEVEQTTIWYEVSTWDVVNGPNVMKVDADVSGWGINIEPGFVLIAGENIFVQIGFRYQQVWIDADVDTGGTTEEVTGLRDYLYGGYLSVLYKL